MIKSVEFRNFKVLKNATLPLEQFTLIIGPNGSGKSTAIQALTGAILGSSYPAVATAGLDAGHAVEVVFQLAAPFEGVSRQTVWNSTGVQLTKYQPASDARLTKDVRNEIERRLKLLKRYSLDPAAIAGPVSLNPIAELSESGGGLAAVLDRLRDNEPDRFEALNQELPRWVPEFDHILFDVPASGNRAFKLRNKSGQFSIPAKDLSHGTLLALAILTLAYLPDPPSLVCLEEPDRGIHPRLLREVQDALYRLAYAERYSETRQPVQVLVTTHSPYLLDLYKDYPEQIVVAQRVGDEARFERLSDQPHIEEILEGASLGEIWYSGILGGVPCEH
jgi:predicted ATPase